MCLNCIKRRFFVAEMVRAWRSGAPLLQVMGVIRHPLYIDARRTHCIVSHCRVNFVNLTHTYIAYHPWLLLFS